MLFVDISDDGTPVASVSKRLAKRRCLKCEQHTPGVSPVFGSFECECCDFGKFRVDGRVDHLDIVEDLVETTRGNVRIAYQFVANGFKDSQFVQRIKGRI